MDRQPLEMVMTLRERILAVYEGREPDVVPFMLDLSHWFYATYRRPWDLSLAYTEPEDELIAFHEQVGAGFYMPNLAAFYTTDYAADVEVQTEKREVSGGPEISWSLGTPEGMIVRRRRWHEATYAWGISRWGIETPRDLRIFARAMAGRRFASDWRRYHAWVDCVGDTGVVYLSAGYSAMGHLLNLWMGVERAIYACADEPDLMREVVDTVNAGNLELIDLLCTSPAEVIVMGDNFSSDVQPPGFFARWSRPYYAEAIARLHRAGKKVAIHIDGQLRGALEMFRQLGADCADAVTPKPLGDLTPAECRDEAGHMILSGGVSPELWLSTTPRPVFEASVRDWLALKARSPRLIANAGDQVPPGADPDRIEVMRDLVEGYGRFEEDRSWQT